MNDPATDNLPVLWPVNLLNPTQASSHGYTDDVYLNIKNLIAIEPCGSNPGTDPPLAPSACYIMASDQTTQPHILNYKSTALFHKEVSRFNTFLAYLRTPNVAPTVTIAGPDTLPYDTAGTLVATVVDTPGDVHTFEWSESSAAKRGGTFGTPYAGTTTYTVPLGEINNRAVIVVRVTDAKGETATATHHLTLTG